MVCPPSRPTPGVRTRSRVHRRRGRRTPGSCAARRASRDDSRARGGAIAACCLAADAGVDPPGVDEPIRGWWDRGVASVSVGASAWSGTRSGRAAGAGGSGSGGVAGAGKWIGRPTHTSPMASQSALSGTGSIPAVTRAATSRSTLPSSVLVKAPKSLRAVRTSHALRAGGVSSRAMVVDPSIWRFSPV